MGILGNIRGKIISYVVETYIKHKLKEVPKMWEWFNGKKTIIGAVCLFIAETVINGLIVGDLQYNPEWLTVVQTVLVWAGNILLPGGLLHKGIKKAKKL